VESGQADMILEKVRWRLMFEFGILRLRKNNFQK